MAVTQIQVPVEQNQYAVLQGFVNFTSATIAALKSGNPLQEAIAIGSAALTDLPAIVPLLPAAEAEVGFNAAEINTVSAFLGQLLTAIRGQ